MPSLGAPAPGATLSERADVSEEQMLSELERVYFARSVLFTSGERDPRQGSVRPGERRLQSHAATDGTAQHMRAANAQVVGQCREVGC